MTTTAAPTAAEPERPPARPGAAATLALLAVAAVTGVIASLAAWGFLELTHQIQVGVFTDLPKELGFGAAPVWWPLPPLVVAGVVTALAITRLPGNGGHVPAHGLNAGATQPVELPGAIVAGLACVSLGTVLGPEAPLIAIGGGLGLLTIRLARRDAPPQVATVMAAAGTFAAVALIFDSPILAAVLLIEASGLGGKQLPLVLVPGLLAAGIGSLLSIGMGAWTGLSTSAYAISALSLPDFPRPTVADFGWTVALGAAIALGGAVIMRGGRLTERLVAGRLLALLPIVALAVGGLAIAFSEATGKGTGEVLFSGQDALPGLVHGSAGWSLGALAALVAFKGVGWSLSLGAFRGGPTFPAMFLGAAAGLLAAHLPGFATTPAVAVGIGAGVAAILRLPLSAVVIATVLTANSGLGAAPLVIVGVVTAFLVSQLVSPRNAAPAPAAEAS